MNSITQSSQLLIGTIHCYPISMTCDARQGRQHQQRHKSALCMLWFFMLIWVWLACESKHKLECTCGCRCRCVMILWCMMVVRVDGEWNEKWFARVNAFAKLTCSCDPLGFPAARRQLWPGPDVRRSGSTWAACPIEWPRHLARHTRSPSTSLGSAFPGETVQTGRRPAGSLSPGLRWLQTSWQRRWAAPFAAEGKGRREGAGKGEHNSKAGRDEIKRRKKDKIRKWWCARMAGEQAWCVRCVRQWRVGREKKDKVE